MTHVYLDHNATTALDERVLEAMLPYMKDQYGNASSRHELGTRARKAVNHAREQLAGLVNVQPSQVIFMSGGTEANNLFIKGAAGYLRPTQIAVSAIEHPCVARPAQDLARAKPSEIDFLNGHVVRKGAELGIPTPTNHALQVMVKLTERGKAMSAQRK